jgi:hypothetical protein
MVDHIEDVISNFDFHRVYKTMVTLDWNWYTTAGRVPTIGEMQEFARSLLETAANKPGIYSSGGFFAMCEGNSLSLMFCVDDVTVEKKDEDGDD